MVLLQNRFFFSSDTSQRNGSPLLLCPELRTELVTKGNPGKVKHHWSIIVLKFVDTGCQWWKCAFWHFMVWYASLLFFHEDCRGLWISIGNCLHEVWSGSWNSEKWSLIEKHCTCLNNHFIIKTPSLSNWGFTFCRVRKYKACPCNQRSPNVWLKPTTLRLRVSCSTTWANWAMS